MGRGSKQLWPLCLSGVCFETEGLLEAARASLRQQDWLLVQRTGQGGVKDEDLQLRSTGGSLGKDGHSGESGVQFRRTERGVGRSGH